MEINHHLAVIESKIMALESHIQETDDRALAMELVVSWILSKHPEHEAHLFLASQANEMQEHPKLSALVKLLDDLREHLSVLRTST